MTQVENSNNEIQDGNNKKPIVYKQRFLILASYMITYFLWNWWSARHVILSRTYAKYHNVSTEVPGVDLLSVISNIFVILTYPMAAYLIDRFGLKMMIIGNGFLALSCWMWYGAFENFTLVVIAQALGSAFGTVTSVAILAVSNRWFPEQERGQATAAGAVFGLLGAGASIIGASFFHTESELAVDFDLINCSGDESLAIDVSNATQEQFEFCGVEEEEGGNPVRQAFDAGCLYQPADIPQYNLVMAILQTLAFLFSLAVVRDLPPTPPSFAAEDKSISAGMISSFKSLLTNKRIIWISITDIFVTGPPSVLFFNIERILPARVSCFAISMGAAGIALAIPFSFLFGYILDRKKNYYFMTASGYSLATFLWFIACIGFTVDNLAGSILVIICGAVAILAYVVWQVSEYELKLEWAFEENLNVEGAVAALDRMVINLSVIIFVSAIPPERFSGGDRAGGFYTFWIGLGALIFGTIFFLFAPDKYHYLRLEHEKKRAADGLAPSHEDGKRRSLTLAPRP